MGKVTVGCLAVSLAGFSVAHASEADAYIEACEAVTKSRQRIPELYRRTSVDVDVHILTREEVLKNLEGWKPDRAKKNLEEFEAGSWSPRTITVTFDYEATNAQSEVVKKRSLCEGNAARETLSPEQKFLIVDGEMQAFWKPAK